MSNINFIGLIDNFLHSFDTPKPKSLGTIILEGAKCNMKCDYCFIEACSKEKPQIEINEKNIVDTLRKYKPDNNSYIVIWAGEPLFNKGAFVKICELINRELPGVQIHINTNGTLLDDWWADFIISHNVYINLSHDGPGQRYRGVDFFNSDKHVKAIKTIVKAEHLNDIATVIHKYNCSFNDIKDFFEKARNEKGIIPKNYEFLLVAPNLNNEIIYDFDPLDPSLIKFINDSISYIITAMINNSAIYSEMVKQVWLVIKDLYSETHDVDFTKGCSEYENKEFSISTMGEHRCVRGFFNRDHNIKVMKDHLDRCQKCEVNYACPLRKCVAVSLDDKLCASLKNRLITIKSTVDNIIALWSKYELFK